MTDRSSRFHNLSDSSRDSDASCDSFSTSSYSSEFRYSDDTSINDGVGERRGKAVTNDTGNRKEAVTEKKRISIQQKYDATSDANARRELLPTMRSNSILDGGKPKWRGGDGMNEKSAAKRLPDKSGENKTVVNILKKDGNETKDSLLKSSMGRWRGRKRRSRNVSDSAVKVPQNKKEEDRVLVEISKENELETKDSVKNSILLLRQRKSQLESAVEAMSLDMTQAKEQHALDMTKAKEKHALEMTKAKEQHAELLYEILSHKEELTSLQRDAKLAKEGKERSEAECKLLRSEARGLVEQLNGERIALCRAEGEKKEALRQLKEIEDERNRIATGDAFKLHKKFEEESSIAKAELSRMQDEADAIKSRLKEEEERIAKQMVELDEERRQILIDKTELSKIMTEQENIRRELNEEENMMQGYDSSLNIRMEELAKREKICRENEVAVTGR